jgi:predicted hotdog family 3-hydroxylacyl-ACP dehydratase
VAFPHISELLPHQGGAIWLHEIVSFEAPHCECLGLLPQWIAGSPSCASYGIELVAQAAAVYAGLREGSPKAGYVASVQSAIFDEPTLPATVPLRVRVTETNVLGRAKSFVGQVWRDDARLLSIEFVVIETPGGHSQP